MERKNDEQTPGSKGEDTGLFGRRKRGEKKKILMKGKQWKAGGR